MNLCCPRVSPLTSQTISNIVTWIVDQALRNNGYVFPDAEGRAGNACVSGTSISEMQSMLLQQGVYQVWLISNIPIRMIFSTIMVIVVILQWRHMSITVVTRKTTTTTTTTKTTIINVITYFLWEETTGNWDKNKAHVTSEEETALTEMWLTRPFSLKWPTERTERLAFSGAGYQGDHGVL